MLKNMSLRLLVVLTLAAAFLIAPALLAPVLIAVGPERAMLLPALPLAYVAVSYAMEPWNRRRDRVRYAS